MMCPRCGDVELEMVTEATSERGSFECPECGEIFSEADLDVEDADDEDDEDLLSDLDFDDGEREEFDDED